MLRMLRRLLVFTGGEHGYNNSMQSMHPFFVAMGPSFKSAYSVETFNTVDLYPLMCLLLGIPAAPNNGSLEIVKTLLKDEIKHDIKEGIPAWACKSQSSTPYNYIRFASSVTFN